MFIFRHGSRRAVVHSGLITAQRAYASKIDIPFSPPPVPVIDACPSPTCQCREMPPGLDIEREQNINGSMAAYAEQVLISTGRSDWASRIEEEKEGVLVRTLKGLIGPRGRYSDPYHNVMLTNSSFAPTSSANNTSAFLLPSFQYVPDIPPDTASVEALVKAYILPSQLHQSHDRLTRGEKNALLRQPEMQNRFEGARPVNEILVLICGHGGRDARCGTLGPLLQKEFEEKLQRQNIELLHEPHSVKQTQEGVNVDEDMPAARVGLISHIGGHKWAGNVIVYIPPTFPGHPLAGKGIWYGRVGPQHVEGIVQKTIIDGKVIKELFRGGIDQDRKIIRL